ncbi:MAG: hypothetical protein ABSF64_37880 [Bryobacteraceae bacterium]
MSAEEIVRLKAALDEKMHRKVGKGINQTFFHLRLIVLDGLDHRHAMCPELGAEFKRYPVILGEDRIVPPEPGAKRERQRVEEF